MAGCTFGVDIQLAREGTTTDTGAIGLGDAQHVVQHAGADAGTGGRLTGYAVGRGDEGIGAVVDVEQGTLSSFEQHVLAGLVGVVQRRRDVDDHRPDDFGVGHGLVVDGLEINRIGLEILGQDEVVILKDFLELFGKTLRMEQVVHAQAATRHLVLVGRTNAFAGRTNLFVGALGTLAGLIDRRMVRQDDRTSRADLQPRTNVDTALFQLGNFGNQVMDIEHDAVADITIDAIAHDAGRYQIQLVDVLADNQGVAGIVTALETNDATGVIGQPVDDLAFTLVAPLGTYHDDILGHFFSPLVLLQ
ncbi:hypothetical protein SDC9_140646 [bioreactor metagenome]|uniref:NAD-specific glutamate dehydrogenase n=1 Tax=bioreactor metagenome TaxID=1076179 RepID=A0A645DWK3_9ZZZZ